MNRGRIVWLCGISLGMLVGFAVREFSWLSSSSAQAPPLIGNPPTAYQLPVNPSSISSGTDGQPEFLSPDERINVAVYDQCNRSVVHIATRATEADSFLMISERKGTGSGSVIDKHGYILTNFHVIDGAREVTVSLSDGLPYPAALVGQDPDTDIAVLKIDAPADELTPIAWGDSQNLKVGQRIFAIGNPFGLERTMSTGIISSLNRQIPSGQRRTMRSLIQIDAALNQGNSGGPLINTRGQLIGMNAAIVSSSGDSAGVGFAIPVSTLRRIVPQLIRDGRVVRPTIGITRVYESQRGLLVVSVAPGGPAAQAGVQGFNVSKKSFRQGPYRYEHNSVDPKAADLIKAIDGRPIGNVDDLLDAIENKQPGDSVVLDIVRQGRAHQVTTTLGQDE